MPRTEADLQRALWGQFITTVELGVEGAADILQEFEQGWDTFHRSPRPNSERVALPSR